MERKMERNKKKAEKDEVEELLQAAQDELLLQLSLNSHTAHAPPDGLPSDLDRRFQALKSRPSVPNSSSSPPSQPQKSEKSTTSSAEHELSARFAALRGSYEQDDDDPEDEVEKLIRWAKDAARLDPSPPSDDEDGDDDDEADEHPPK